MSNLGLVIEYVFCLPETSGPVERICLLMNSAWCDERGTMCESTVRSLFMCKVNFGISCTECYEKIKKQVILVEKYSLH